MWDEDEAAASNNIIHVGKQGKSIKKANPKLRNGHGQIDSHRSSALMRL